MTTFRLFIFSILLFSFSKVNAQKLVCENPSIEISDFAAVHQFLASDWMEGRETGEKGSFIASDYIASMMQVYGLLPYGDDKLASAFDNQKRSYFQTFELIRYRTESASLTFISQDKDSRIAKQLSLGIDFEVQAASKSLDGEGKLVFAGYGISAPEIGHDDYKKLNIQGRIVIFMDGFPGFKNENSVTYHKFKNSIAEEKTSEESKLKIAMEKGAIAVIVLNAANPIKNNTRNSAISMMAMHTNKFVDPEYSEDYYTLPGEEENQNIPLFKMSKEAAADLLKDSNIDLKAIEEKSEQNLNSYTQEINKRIAFSVNVNSQAMIARNVLGIIPGKDETKNIIIGAHYDHLGIRNGQIFNGSDDNASGTAGMLTLAKYWNHKAERPPFNIIFAAWTAEEIGHWGSIYFADKFRSTPENTLLNINFDMISRSAPEDTTGLVLSVGMMEKSVDLRDITLENNLRLEKPFLLDLWDSSSGGGSDYATFNRRGIPVLTYFSGYNNDYHTIRDISYYADYGKMEAILNFTKDCLNDFIKNTNQK